MLLAYESCCTEKWLVSYYDTNHFAQLKRNYHRPIKGELRPLVEPRTSS
jgi:hypothetical protein